MTRAKYIRPLLILIAAATIAGADAVAQQTDYSQVSSTPITLTLDEAVQVALARSYAVREARLDVEVANAQVREAFGTLVPQIDLNTTYTRNVKSANPFAGSEAGGLFQTLGFIDWLAFNELARTDSDPTTDPITLLDFTQQRQDALEDAGAIVSGSDNPFAIPNQATASITAEQTLFDMRAILGAAGAKKYLAALNRSALERQEQLIVNDVRQAFYGALLAEENARVVRQSADRTRATRDETAQRVASGVLPKVQRLSADVELANLESNLIRARKQSADAVDGLKLLLGMPVEQEVILHGELESEIEASVVAISVPAAVAAALERRADLEQARIAIELQQVQQRVSRSDYFPTITAFGSVGYVGSVPANRQSIISNPNDPFSFSVRQNGIFSDNYWDLTASVGVRLSWNLFNGLQTHNRMQRQKLETERVRLRYEQLQQSVRAEVQSALRELEATQLQIASQEQNVVRADLNYSHARARLDEGVASQLEERQASDLLDQSRLTYLQAIHDFLAARSELEAAIGATSGATTELNITSAAKPGRESNESHAANQN